MSSTKPKSTFMTVTGGAIAVVVAFMIAMWLDDDDAVDRYTEKTEREQTAIFTARYLTSGRTVEATWGKRGQLAYMKNPPPSFRQVMKVKAGDRLTLRVTTDRPDQHLDCAITVDGHKYSGDVHAREDADNGDVCEVSVTVKA